MKYLLLFVSFILSSHLWSDEAEDQYFQETNEDNQQTIWIGPGLYYGVWFYSEGEYNDWYQDHYQNNTHDEYPNGNDHGGGNH